MRSAIDWPVPLYGTCTRSTPAMLLNISPAKCGVLPLPAEGKLSLPGCAWAYAINSFTDFTGNDGCTTTKCGTEAVSVTGAKSLITSYGNCGNKLGAMALTDTCPIISV